MVGVRGGELDELFGIADGKVTEEEGVDEGEDSSVGADAEGERENGDGGEGGRFGQGAESVAEGLKKIGDGELLSRRVRGAFKNYAKWGDESSSMFPSAERERAGVLVLLVPQRFDGVEARRFPGGVDAENDADESANDKSGNDPRDGQGGGKVGAIVKKQADS